MVVVKAAKWMSDCCHDIFLRTLQRLGGFDFSFAKVGEARALQVPVPSSLFLHKIPTRFPHFLLNARWWLKKMWYFRILLEIPCI
jgi:hypothetical protein